MRRWRPAILGGGAFDSLDGGNKRTGQTITAADDADANIMLGRAPGLAEEIGFEQTKKRANLAGRALPIVRGKSEQSERIDAEPGRDANNPAHHFNAGAMPGGAVQTAHLGPAAIAIHDDGDMNPLRRNDIQNTFFHEV